MTTNTLFGTITKASLSGQGTTLGSREVEADASLPTVDLMDDIVVSGGCTPSSGSVPVAFNHDMNQPLGRATFRATGSKVTCKITFLPEGVSARADEICAAVKLGFLDAVSIGFSVLTSSPRKGAQRGRKYETWTLNEISIVLVGAHDQARVTAKSADSGSDRAARLQRAAEVASIGRQQRARELAAGNVAPPPTGSDHLTGMSKAARMAHARAVAERGGQHPKPQLGLREAAIQRDAGHARAVASYAPLSREGRIERAEHHARKIRPAGFG